MFLYIWHYLFSNLIKQKPKKLIKVVTQLPHLRFLDIRSIPITDKHLRAISKSSLHYLFLQCCGELSVGMKIIYTVISFVFNI